jgi:hypothetical protein
VIGRALSTPSCLAIEERRRGSLSPDLFSAALAQAALAEAWAGLALDRAGSGAGAADLFRLFRPGRETVGTRQAQRFRGCSDRSDRSNRERRRRALPLLRRGGRLDAAGRVGVPRPEQRACPVLRGGRGGAPGHLAGIAARAARRRSSSRVAGLRRLAARQRGAARWSSCHRTKRSRRRGGGARPVRSCPARDRRSGTDPVGGRARAHGASGRWFVHFEASTRASRLGPARPRQADPVPRASAPAAAAAADPSVVQARRSGDGRA